MTLCGPRRKPHGISKAGSSAVTVPPQGLAPEGEPAGLLGDCRRQPCPVNGGCSLTNGRAAGCWPAGVSATQVVGTRKLRLCGALIFKMENVRESCTVFFLSRLLFYIEQKEKKQAGGEGAPPTSPGVGG